LGISIERGGTDLARPAPRQINRRRCEAAHTSSEMGKLFVAPLPPRAEERLCYGGRHAEHQI
jgi:hypothetical protein